jgi:hypothetical protein
MINGTYLALAVSRRAPPVFLAISKTKELSFAGLLDKKFAQFAGC